LRHFGADARSMLELTFVAAALCVGLVAAASRWAKANDLR
jgi:hypothetical protein